MSVCSLLSDPSPGVPLGPGRPTSPWSPKYTQHTVSQSRERGKRNEVVMEEEKMSDEKKRRKGQRGQGSSK